MGKIKNRHLDKYTPPRAQRDLWKPTDEELENLTQREGEQGFRRYEMKDGFYTFCRHYGKCGKENCTNCYVCPVCGGKLYFDNSPVKKGGTVYQVSAKECLQCSARYEGQVTVMKTQKPSNQCGVVSCKHPAWHEHDKWEICDEHYRRIRNFEKFGGTEPLVTCFGELVENPEWKKG